MQIIELRNRIYYAIKPLIPSAVRLWLRRKLTAGKRHSAANVWPILPGSEKKPSGWPGWPEGRQFGFVIVHDVEGGSGLDKCQRLMDLDKTHGFRSAFNFIPEGAEYRVTPEFRDQLARNGFEVGVHDLRHDGKLYRTRAEFGKNAERINHYIREWNASGFRSGFMHHNVDWLHDLNIAYDSSTFDTDPFEPQPDGVNTIFPFRVNSSGDRAGYVELPSTLPQDSTLFILLREKSIDIWKRKLDFIAEHGGLAVLNIHPDYVQFDGEPAASGTYPVSLYVEFLNYIREQYRGRYWHALPRDVAAHVSNSGTARADRRVPSAFRTGVGNCAAVCAMISACPACF